MDRLLKDCCLCPRNCHIDRIQGQKGVCHADAKVKVARAALHMWEEPCISGKEGSGAVFFSGCSLGCIFCQNQKISRGQVGKEITVSRLAEIFLELQEQKANNINLVTAGHYVPQVAEALQIARDQGLIIPVVYNSSGYEKADTLKMLEGLVDIYLPDFKYMDDKIAAEYSRAGDYSQVAKRALAEMVRQAGDPIFDERGMMQKGVIVRLLLLPGQLMDARAIVKYLYTTYGNRIYISFMSQYTPMPQVADHPLLGQKVSRKSYKKLLDYALDLGVEQGFFQEGDVAKDSFIPEFDNTGVSL
ncbi:MAG: radical SAM protein [Muricoprocola sp.]